MFDNLAIDSWQMGLLYLLTAGVIACLWLLAKYKVHFSIRVLVGLVLGVLIGSIFKERATVLASLGSIYVSLIMMIVVPLVFTSIIQSFITLGKTEKMKRISIKVVFWLMITTAMGAVFALAMGTLFNLGAGFDVTGIDYSPREIVPFENVIVDFFPRNIIAHMAENQMIPVIIFALFIALGINGERKRNNDKVEVFASFIESLHTIMIRITKMVLRFTPYGVFGLIANATGRNNLSTLQALGLYIIVFYLTMALFLLLVQLPLVWFKGKMNPVTFLKNVYPAQIVGFASQSSLGTMPLTIRSLHERNGVSQRIASFASPLGANVGMNACGGMFPAFVAIITANAFGLELVATDYLIIILTTMIASIGIAGVPGIASIAASVVLVALGLPLEGIGLVIGVDALIDMGRTAINITGTLVSASLTARSENELDDTIFTQENAKTHALAQ